MTALKTGGDAPAARAGRDASVRRGPGRVRPGRAVRRQPAGAVVRPAVQRESRLRHVGRAAAVAGGRPARGRHRAAQRRCCQVLDRLRDRSRRRRRSAPPSSTCSAARGPTTSACQEREHETIEATMAPVTPGFFETMRIPLLAGRGFVRPRHRPGSAAPVVVNEAFAGATSARAGGRPHPSKRASAKRRQRRARSRRRGRRHAIRPAQARGADHLHSAAATQQRHDSRACGRRSRGARRRGCAKRSAPRVRSFRVTTITTQSAVVDRTLLRERLLALLSGFFALVGLVLAAVGLYGVLSYSVVQRTREIGIRVALGARQLGVVRTVLTDAGAAALVGAVFGLAAALYCRASSRRCCSRSRRWTSGASRCRSGRCCWRRCWRPRCPRCARHESIR